MPRWLRVLVTSWAFLMFFAGSPLIGWVLFPLVRLRSSSTHEYRERCTRILSRGQRIFASWLERWRLVEAPRTVALPSGIDPSKPYVLIANHPSLIDVVLLLGWFDRLTCVAKAGWYRSIVLGPLLRASNYLRGPTSGAMDEADGVRGAMVEHLRRGHPLLVFPEGTRSLPGRMHRFRRGAVDAAIRAGVPIVPVFVAIDRPFLVKGAPFWAAPRDTARYSIEVWDAIDTSGLTEDDGRELNQSLQRRYQERFARVLESRQESAAA